MIAHLKAEFAPRGPSTTPVWIAGAASVLLVFALVAAGQGTLARVAIPAAALVTGFALYSRCPIGYVHFVLWTWFLTPLVRRLVDWRLGFEDHNLILISPVLVSAVAGLTLLRERHWVGTVRVTPFLLSIAGILYGFVVGLVRWRLHASEAGSLAEIVYALFEWLAPLLFGLHLYLRWTSYKEQRDAVQKSFLLATLSLGLYAIYQYVKPPAWDTVWLEHVMTELGDLSFGRPEPFQIRSWSTLNSPGVFANALMAGLLFLFSIKSRIKPLATAAGYSAFLLTLVRTSWLGWFVGLLVIARDSKGRQIRRLVISLVFLPLAVAPLMASPEIAAIITDRIQTMHSTKQDESFQDRAEEYRALILSLLEDPFGEGLNNAQNFHGYIMDSGIIRLFYSCGWIGTALFVAGIASFVRRMPSDRNGSDPAVSVYRAVLFAMIGEMLSGNTFTGPSAAITWTCIGLALSYYQGQQSEPSQPIAEGDNRSGFGNLAAIA